MEVGKGYGIEIPPSLPCPPSPTLLHIIVWTLDLCEINYGAPFLCTILSQRQFWGGGLYGVLPNYNFDFQIFGYANSEKTRDFLYLESENFYLGSV